MHYILWYYEQCGSNHVGPIFLLLCYLLFWIWIYSFFFDLRSLPRNGFYFFFLFVSVCVLIRELSPYTIKCNYTKTVLSLYGIQSFDTIFRREERKMVNYLNIYQIKWHAIQFVIQKCKNWDGPSVICLQLVYSSFHASAQFKKFDLMKSNKFLFGWIISLELLKKRHHYDDCRCGAQRKHYNSVAIAKTSTFIHTIFI